MFIFVIEDVLSVLLLLSQRYKQSEVYTYNLSKLSK